MWRNNPSMPYREWKETLGSNRWYDSEGNSRTYVPLDHTWKPLYDLVTKDADRVFHEWEINDVGWFTDNFLSLVPHAWLKFKTNMEMFLGTLTGTTIDPQEFYAGFERWTTHNLTWDDTEDVSNTTNSDTNSNTKSSDTSNYGARSGDTKARAINYNQGVQDNDRELTDDNIGALGSDYASSNQDQVSFTKNSAYVDTQEGSSNTTADNNSTSKGNRKYDRAEMFDEHVKENRINFYDQLAFLRERFDRLDGLNMFWKEFQHLFTNVSVYEIIF